MFSQSLKNIFPLFIIQIMSLTFFLTLMFFIITFIFEFYIPKSQRLSIVVLLNLYVFYFSVLLEVLTELQLCSVPLDILNNYRIIVIYLKISFLSFILIFSQITLIYYGFSFYIFS